jgi:Na+/melibiose symporter-like transporter
MNCHGKHDNRNEKENENCHEKGQRGHLSHMLMMALCCGAPIIILLLIPLISKAGGPGTAKFFAAVAPFLCPLMMVGMLPMMFRGGKGKTSKGSSVPSAQQSGPDENNVAAE